MKIRLSLIIILVAIVVILFIATSFTLTGNVTGGYDYIERNGFTCEDPDQVKDTVNNPRGDLFVKGTTTRTDSSENVQTETDVCDGNKRVVEYYCSSRAVLEEKKVSCPNSLSCVNGACVR